jgi:hypothetical protein
VRILESTKPRFTNGTLAAVITVEARADRTRPATSPAKGLFQKTKTKMETISNRGLRGSGGAGYG